MHITTTHTPTLSTIQKIQWRSDRFPVKQPITPDYVGRHLAPTSTNAEVVDMVGQVAAEKANVNGLLEDGIEDFLGMVAEITGATYPCKYGGGASPSIATAERMILLDRKSMTLPILAPTNSGWKRWLWKS